MLRSETFTIAIDALRANKMRAFLTMIGVIIGSACIVLVVTISLTGRQYILGLIEGVGSNLIIASAVHSPGRSTALSYEITMDDLAEIQNSIPGVAAVAGTRDLDGTIVVNGVEHPATLLGVTQEYQKVRNIVILAGRYFDQDDMQLHNKVCLITDELSKKVFANQDPVGQSMRVNELSFIVVGVFREKVETFGQSEVQSNSVAIPFTVMEDYTGENFVGGSYIEMASPDQVASGTDRVEQILIARHPQGASFDVKNLSGILSVAKGISDALSIVLLFIAVVALIVSGVGIMNIMLVTVTERTHEIGIRRAIGARRREILYQFLMESSLISGVGAILGVFAGVSIPVLVQPLIPGNLRVPVPWIAVAAALVVSCSTGVFFGYLPASKASSLQPTESLRYE
jgi:putative ABC transport system permease protein